MPLFFYIRQIQRRGKKLNQRTGSIKVAIDVGNKSRGLRKLRVDNLQSKKAFSLQVLDMWMRRILATRWPFQASASYSRKLTNHASDFFHQRSGWTRDTTAAENLLRGDMDIKSQRMRIFTRDMTKMTTHMFWDGVSGNCARFDCLPARPDELQLVCEPDTVTISQVAGFVLRSSAMPHGWAVTLTSFSA